MNEQFFFSTIELVIKNSAGAMYNDTQIEKKGVDYFTVSQCQT